MVHITRLKRKYAQSLIETYSAKCTDSPFGCMIPDKTPRKDYYVRIAITKGKLADAFGLNAPNGEQTYYLHQVAWYAFHGTVPERNSVHISHLCHNNRCFRSSVLGNTATEQFTKRLSRVNYLFRLWQRYYSAWKQRLEAFFSQQAARVSSFQYYFVRK